MAEENFTMNDSNSLTLRHNSNSVKPVVKTDIKTGFTTYPFAYCK